MATEIVVRAIKPAIVSTNRVDDLVVGNLYTFTYDTNGSSVVGICVFRSDTGLKGFHPLDVNPSGDSLNKDIPNNVWCHPRGHHASGKYTPFVGTITLKSV